MDGQARRTHATTRIRRALNQENPALALEILFAEARAATRPGADGELDALETSGQQVLAAIAARHPLPEATVGFDRPASIYVVTEIYQAGGHRALLEALIAARPQDRHVVLFTMAEDRMRGFSLQRMQELGILALAPDPALGLYDKLLWLREKLGTLAARRLFLMQHPEDVVAGLAVREIAPVYGPRLHVLRHADTVASFGVDLPQATHLAIRPTQRDMLRHTDPRLKVALLPLVAPVPDPAPPMPQQPRRWFRTSERRIKVTATCGTEHKFSLDGPLALPELVARLVAATGGRHLHVGPASPTLVAATHAALDAAGLPHDRLIMAGEVASVRDALRKHEVDLYLGSFPVAGALSLFEAIAARVPVALRDPGADAAPETRYLSGTGLVPGALRWHSAEDLVTLVSQPMDDTARAQMVQQAAGWLARHHSPDRFRRRIAALVAATEGWHRTPLDGPERAAALARLFDETHYLTRNGDVAAAGVDPFQHFLDYGEAEHRAVHPLFDHEWYLAQLPPSEQGRARKRPLTHYAVRGSAAGLSPHPLIDPELCARQLGHCEPGQTLLERYLAAETPVRPHTFFDPDHYARQNPFTVRGPLLPHFLTEGAAAGLSPHPLINLEHLWGNSGRARGYLHSFLGWLRGSPHAGEASPHPLFLPWRFAWQNTTVYAGAVPHLLWGHLVEGNHADHIPHPLILPAHVERARPGTLTRARLVIMDLARNRLGVDTHPLVSNSHIQTQAPHLANGAISPTEFFITHGREAQIDPHPWFSTKFYLLQNPDVTGAGVNPLVHYLHNGEGEGRKPHPFFDPGHYRNMHQGGSAEASPLIHYARHGAGSFAPVMPMPDGDRRVMLKMAQSVLDGGGSDWLAEQHLSAALHPERAPRHPSLRTEVRPLRLTLPPEAAGEEILPAREVALLRPRVVSPTPVRPPSGSYRAPALIAARHSGALVVAGNDGFVLADGTWYDPGLEGFDPEITHLKEGGAVAGLRMPRGADDGAVLLRRFEPEEPIAEGIFACGTYAHNYYHFLIEVLPRAMLAARIAPRGTPVLVDAAMPAQHYQALRIYLPDNPVLRLPRHRTFRVGTLYAANMPNIIHDAFGRPEGSLGAVRYYPEVLRDLGAPGRSLACGTTPRRLFLWRQGWVRQMVNAKALTDTLRDSGFEVVNFATLSFVDQVRHMANAEAVVGQSGAHFANMLFAAPGTQVLPLFSNAPGTNFGLWSGLGDALGLEVINIAGWRMVGTSGIDPEAHENFTLPPDQLTAFFPPRRANAPEQEAPAAVMDLLWQAVRAAGTVSSGWSVRAGTTPPDHDVRLVDLRRRLRRSLLAAPEDHIAPAFFHPLLLHPEMGAGAGLTTLRQFDAEEQATVAMLRRSFAALSEGAAAEDVLDELAGDPRRLMMLAALYQPAMELPLIADLGALPDVVVGRYLDWLAFPPFLFRQGEDAAYARFAAELLGWIADQAERDYRPALRLALGRMARRLDLGLLLMADVPLEGVIAGRNRLLSLMAVTEGQPRARPRAADGSEGRIRIGILCRTFHKGPDSEAVAALFQAFDRNRIEIVAYSIGHQDRVVSDDAEFARIFAQITTRRRVLPDDPAEMRARIIEDQLDVFLHANATTFGIGPMDLALFHRVAPVQVELNSHLPAASGYPSFDAVITGISDDPEAEVPDSAFPARTIRLPGPVITYLTSLQPKDKPPLDRAALGLGPQDVVLFNAGAAAKLRRDALRCMMQATAEIPNGVLMLAPYNPGWAGRSQAYAFNRQLAETAAEVGLDPTRIRVLGELTVAETEAALALADLYLAPFPHGGATMLHLALIYGVPPVVLRRRSLRSIDQFLVGSLGLHELLASTPDNYVALAADLGRDPARRQAIADRIRATVRKPPFVDNPEHSRAMQDAILRLVAEEAP